ncbi:hypothetical protein WBP06_20905 [Novosphingobium sp. BL-8H]|uniref:hypothetical protein n=1 Tax=Novosphingobium sp. BL-8H TaxID=3127640 RepID=UPI0037572D87
MDAYAQHDILEAAIRACKHARQPARDLDAEIALALFPSLRELSPVEPGIWR